MCREWGGRWGSQARPGRRKRSPLCGGPSCALGSACHACLACNTKHNQETPALIARGFRFGWGAPWSISPAASPRLGFPVSGLARAQGILTPPTFRKVGGSGQPLLSVSCEKLPKASRPQLFVDCDFLPRALPGPRKFWTLRLTEKSEVCITPCVSFRA